jgi:threonine synthase
LSLFDLQCMECGQRREAKITELYCEWCSGLFEIAYNYDVSKMGPRLPLNELGRQITLGEGGSPTVELKSLGKELGLENLWAKLEYLAPTGSFKDRGSSILVSVAREEDANEFVEDSSGNAGASLSAFAAAAGMKAHIFVPKNASDNKLNQIKIYGATLHAIEGPRQAATEAAQAMVTQQGLLYLSHNYSAYFAEGMKAFSYEAVASDAASVQHVVFPVGNGSLLVGASKGFDELVEAEVLAEAPQLHCVQSESISPVVAAINGSAWSSDLVHPTVASGISVSNPPRIGQIIKAVQCSRGSAVAVQDEAILHWQKRLATKEGVFCEATSAAAFAGLEKLIQQGSIPKGSRVLVPVTGSGLKEPLVI